MAIEILLRVLRLHDDAQGRTGIQHKRNYLNSKRQKIKPNVANRNFLMPCVCGIAKLWQQILHDQLAFNFSFVPTQFWIKVQKGCLNPCKRFTTSIMP